MAKFRSRINNIKQKCNEQNVINKIGENLIYNKCNSLYKYDTPYKILVQDAILELNEKQQKIICNWYCTDRRYELVEKEKRGEMTSDDIRRVLCNKYKVKESKESD